MQSSSTFLPRGRFEIRENHLPFVLHLSVPKEQRLVYATSGMEDTGICTERQLTAQEHEMLHLFFLDKERLGLPLRSARVSLMEQGSNQ